MDLDLDFGSADFRGLSQREQVSRCREMATEAARLASNASDEMRGEYLNVATRWLALAEELERNDGPIGGSTGKRYDLK